VSGNTETLCIVWLVLRHSVVQQADAAMTISQIHVIKLLLFWLQVQICHVGISLLCLQ